MPSLASMRQLDPAGDSLQPLGPPVREVRGVPQPVVKPTQTPGIVQLPDGKLATSLPLPPAKPAVKLAEPVYLTEAAIKALCEELEQHAGFIIKTEPCFLTISGSPVQAVSHAYDIRADDSCAKLPAATTVGWKPHDPLTQERPYGATKAMQRCGKVLAADGVCYWKRPAYADYAPDYDVVAWQ